MTQEMFDQEMALANGALPSGLQPDAIGELGAPVEVIPRVMAPS